MSRDRVPKAEAAAAYLRTVNSQVVVEPVVGALDRDTLPGFAADLDLLVDGTDNFPTRFVINDYAVDRGMPWVYGGVVGTTGMSMTIVPGEGPCLRCLIPDLPRREQSPTADVVGRAGIHPSHHRQRAGDGGDQTGGRSGREEPPSVVAGRMGSDLREIGSAS